MDCKDSHNLRETSFEALVDRRISGYYILKELRPIVLQIGQIHFIFMLDPNIVIFKPLMLTSIKSTDSNDPTMTQRIFSVFHKIHKTSEENV